MTVTPLSLSSSRCATLGKGAVRAGQVVVLRALEPGARAALRRVADDVRREVAVGVLAEVERLASDLPLHVRREQDAAVRGVDLSAVDGELRHARDRVVLPVGESGDRPRLPVRRRHDQRREQDDRRDGEARDLRVHVTPRSVFARLETQHQPGEQDEVRDDARAAVADERERDAGQRDDPQDAADDDERLQRERERQPGREQLREAVLGEQRDPEAARDEEHVDEQQRRRADQAELLRERGVDEVGVHERDQRVAVGRRERALAEAGAAELPVRDRVERLHELVALRSPGAARARRSARSRRDASSKGPSRSSRARARAPRSCRRPPTR